MNATAMNQGLFKASPEGSDCCSNIMKGASGVPSPHDPLSYQKSTKCEKRHGRCAPYLDLLSEPLGRIRVPDP